MGILYSKTLGETESVSGSIICYSAHENRLRTYHAQPWWRRKLTQCLAGGRLARERREQELRHLPAAVADSMYDDQALPGFEPYGDVGPYEDDPAPPEPPVIPTVLSTNMVYLDGSPLFRGETAEGSTRSAEAMPDLEL